MKRDAGRSSPTGGAPRPDHSEASTRRGAAERAGDGHGAALAAAYQALDEGDARRSRELALAVLESAIGHDAHLEARALTCLAHGDRIGSRLRRASDSSRRAARLFEQCGDLEGEVRALTILAHVSMLLGRNDEAVEAALLAVSLCDPDEPQAQTVLAHNVLGLAYSWSGDHDRGDASLEKAVRLAAACVPPVGIYQPRLNQVWVEASRLLDERYETGTIPGTARMQALLEECWRLESAGQSAPPLPGLRSMARSISLASSALLAVWQRDFAVARARIEAATDSLDTEKSWLDAFVRWCVAELAWAEGDPARAEQALLEMRDIALAVEHEQLACRAHLFMVQVLEQQGKEEAARREHRALRRRERRVIADGLSSRQSLVTWQIGMRQSERHLQQALVASRQFERWSLEDALTGLANRRCFDQALAERLRTPAARHAPLAVAMVDVDRFKAVNDRFTHQVGDRVLKTVAAVIGSQVRQNDLPARWAGDEFVVLFDAATEAVAHQVCERIGAAIAGFEWGSVAPGLQVSVSIGLSEARPGDTPQSVVHRADESMYRRKAHELRRA